MSTVVSKQIYLRALKRSRLFSSEFYSGLVIGYLLYLMIFINKGTTIHESTLLSHATTNVTKNLSELYKEQRKNELLSNESISKDKENSNTGNEDPLFDKVRIVCWVMTYPAHHTSRASHIKNTWGKRCNTLLFMSTGKDDNLESVVLDIFESSWNLRRKTHAAWRHVHKNHLNDSEWFIAVEDDTYVIVDGLRQFLFEFNHTFPLSFGHLMEYNGFPFLSRTPGYVLSQEALIRFVEHGIDKNLNSDCRSISWSYDDVAMGKCLTSVDVQIIDTRDSLGRLRFLPLPLETLIAVADSNMIDKSKYWSSLSHKPFNQGLNCCSDIALVFHEMESSKMYLMEYMVYHLQAYGIRDIANASVSV